MRKAESNARLKTNARKANLGACSSAKPPEAPAFPGGSGAPICPGSGRSAKTRACWSSEPRTNSPFWAGWRTRFRFYGALEALFLGARLHDLSGQSPGAQLSGLSDSRATVLYATPTQLRVLLDPFARGRGRPVSSMRKVMVGGSKLDPGLRAGCAGLFPGAELHEFYGTAETSFVAIGTGETPPESVGKAYPGVEIRIKRSAAAPADAPRRDSGPEPLCLHRLCRTAFRLREPGRRLDCDRGNRQAGRRRKFVPCPDGRTGWSRLPT